MNPNLAQNLDPKLKETYDRIMGTQANPQPQSQSQPKPVQPSAASIPTPAPPPAPEQKVEMVNINTSAVAAKPAKSGAKLSPIIFVVIGVSFFVIYTVVWLKVFKIF